MMGLNSINRQKIKIEKLINKIKIGDNVMNNSFSNYVGSQDSIGLMLNQQLKKREQVLDETMDGDNMQIKENNYQHGEAKEGDM